MRPVDSLKLTRSATRLALLGLLCLAPAACITRDDASPIESDGASLAGEDLLDGLSADEVLEGAAAAMRRPGFVYHQVMHREQDAGIYSNAGTFEYWLDAEGRLARKHYEMKLDSRPDEAPLGGREIVVDGQLFKLDLETDRYTLAETPAAICKGFSPAESLVYNCRPNQEVDWEVEAGQYDGEPAIVLTGRFHEIGEPDAEIQAEAYYLDPETYLPRYLRGEGVILFGGPTPFELSATFEHDFIPESEMPEGFFDSNTPAEPPATTGADDST